MPDRSDLSAVPPIGTASALTSRVPTVAEPRLNSEDYPLIREFITEAAGHLESAEAHLLKLEAGPCDADAVNAVFRSFHTIKGVAGFLNLRQIGALAHAAENLLELARQGRLEFRGGVADAALEAVDVLKSLVASLDEAARTGSRVAMHEGLPELLRRFEQVATGCRAAPGTAVPLADHRQPDCRTIDPPGDGTVKIPVERIDDLITIVGEVLAAQAQVSQELSTAAAGNKSLASEIAHLGGITRDLQDLAIALRMVPIQSTFQKMARLVRDLSRKSGKQIDLVVRGGETKLDRHVVEALADPLLHMLRNSVDHGIEPADAREKAGKPCSGRIELSARRDAGSVVIAVRDDGRGLNKDRILRKAIECGIVREAEDLTDQQLFHLIFHPGLSTAEKVTDLSGRGVGMDVVKRNIEALRGRIEITSVEGRGTTFVIRLPLPSAVPRAMMALASRRGRIKGAA